MGRKGSGGDVAPRYNRAMIAHRVCPRSPRRRAALAAVVACVVAPTASAALAAAPTPAPSLAVPGDAFAPVPCTAFGYDGDAPAERVVCGEVTVPLRHDDPRGPVIALPVAVVRRTPRIAFDGEAADRAGALSSAATAGPSDDRPLVLLQGGPGGSTIDAYLDLALAPDGDAYGLGALRAQRDLVLLDQRGTRHASPALMCPELVELTRKTIELDLDPDVYYALEDDAVADCRERLDAEGVDVAAFQSFENAADIPAVAAALGYDGYHVYGVSYGSLLALHVLRRRPEGLASVVLDAVVPPSVDFNAQAAQSLDGSLDALFAACAAAADCAAAYPTLEADLADAVERLDAAPVRVGVTDPATGRRYRALFDGRALIDAVHQLLYGGPAVPIVPYLIDAAADGRFAALGALMSLWAFDDTLAEGMYFSTVCSEDGDIDPELPLDGVRPWLADRLAGDADDLLAGCAIWDVPALGAAVDAPVASDTPALLLSGRFDPITPPAFAAAAARTLSRATHVVFPSGSHGALGEPCANAVVAAFLAHPGAPVDAACAAAARAPDFRTPADTVFSPVPRTVLDHFAALTGEAEALGADAGTPVDPAVDGPRDAAPDRSRDAASDLSTDAAPDPSTTAAPDAPPAAPTTLDGRPAPAAPGPWRTLAPLALCAAAWLWLAVAGAGWLLGRAFGAAPDARRPARLVPWLVLGATASPPVFAIGLAVVLWQLVEAGHEMVFYVGLPRGAAWLLALPPLGAACGLALAAVAAWAWRARAFGLGRRLVATSLGAAGAGLAVGLVWLGLVGRVG